MRRHTEPPVAMRSGSLLAFVTYAVVAVVYTHPLLMQSTRQIANDRFDPVLNASILWWNSTTIPFTPAWWTPPHYYPSRDVAAFTENLVGLLPVSAPLQWLTDDAILTYNLTFLLTWPLSGLTAFLLVRRMTGRSDAAFVGGLVFAFAPYRISQMGHLQVLACFWFPLTLFALHAYVDERRTRWLVLFGAAWLLQSWTNGYFLLFGGLIIAGWILYFCTTAERRTLIVPIAAAWIVSSLPLLGTLLKYRAVHEAYALERPYDAIVAFSAQPSAWGQISNLSSYWPRWLKDVDPETNLFPGLTALTLVIVAGVSSWLTARSTDPDDRRHPGFARAAGAAAVLFAAVVTATLILGPWRLALPGIAIRNSTIDRPLMLAALAAVFYLALSPHLKRTLAARPPFVFYTSAVVGVFFLSMGPEIRLGRSVLMESAPYSWLLWLPGFNGLRVPPRFWMLGMLCLGAAAGLAFARLAPRARSARVALLLVVSAGVLLDGWLKEMPTGNPPERWTRVEPPNRERALIELPLGPYFDAAATFRAVGHRRRVVNGVSGYDPPHYAPLQTALNDRDVSVLTALAAVGPLDVVVDTRSEGEWYRYVASVPGARQIQQDGHRILFALPDSPPLAEDGPMLVRRTLTDGERDQPSVDLGSVRHIGSLVLVANGKRESLRSVVAVEVSDDESPWREVWRGSTMGLIVVGEMLSPHGTTIAVPINASARRVRLRRLDSGGSWPLDEIRVHAPAGA
jgi:hypothetical protein